MRWSAIENSLPSIRTFLLLSVDWRDREPGLALFRGAQQDYLDMQNTRDMPAKAPEASVPPWSRGVADDPS